MKPSTWKQFLTLTIILFTACVSLAAADFEMVKSLTVQEGDRYDKNVVSLGGTIQVLGTLGRSIIMVGGCLEIEGTVNEDVICLASEVRLGENAEIKGELLVIGGSLEKTATSRIVGESFYFRFDLKKIESTLLPIISDTRTITFLRIIKIVLWFILTLVVLALLPGQVNQASRMLGNNLVRVGVTGLLALLIFVFLLILFIILSFLLIGIPFLLVLILLYFGLLIFGRTVVFYFIGLKLTRLINLKIHNPSFLLLGGVLVYAALKFVPLAGPLMLFLLNICELGVAMVFLLRKRLKPVIESG